MQLLSQSEDPLLSEKEAEKVETIIAHIKDTSTVQNILSRLSEKNIPEDIDAREIFYITRRASIIDVINNSSQDIANILRQTHPEIEKKIPMSVVMALVINEIIITLSDHAQLSHIHTVASDSSYRTCVTVNGKRKYGNSSHTVQSRARALRTILKRRSQLFYERDTHKSVQQKNQQQKTILQWLIHRWILEEVHGGYKIRNLSYSKKRRSNAYKISYSTQKNGKRFSISRSTSEHGKRPAYEQVIEWISKFHHLSEHEKQILMELYCK